jgi:hypothetical protein
VEGNCYDKRICTLSDLIWSDVFSKIKARAIELDVIQISQVLIYIFLN